jgi:hypothetical protein
MFMLGCRPMLRPDRRIACPSKHPEIDVCFVVCHCDAHCEGAEVGRARSPSLIPEVT